MHCIAIHTAVEWVWMKWTRHQQMRFQSGRCINNLNSDIYFSQLLWAKQKPQEIVIDVKSPFNKKFVVWKMWNSQYVKYSSNLSTLMGFKLRVICAIQINFTFITVQKFYSLRKSKWRKASHDACLSFKVSHTMKMSMAQDRMWYMSSCRFISIIPES